ncbi:MAG: lecithin retinol acyltransferase family protein [Leptothrix sp. (in: b-proteobacteria)]
MGLLGLIFGGPLGSLLEDAGISTPKGAVQNLAESIIDNVIRDKISSPVIGSVVYCDLLNGYAEHSGIYIGNNSIIHLDGSGKIEIVSPDKFLNRLGGFNSAISIYVSCKNGLPVGSKEAAKRAKEASGNSRNYNFLLNNCHQFTAGCLSGDFENSCNFLTFLKNEAAKKIGSNEWRVWDR